MDPARLSDAQLLSWFSLYFWTFVRIGAVMMVAPIFGSRVLSTRIRLIMTFALAALVAPVLPTPPPMHAFESQWFGTLATQVIIGVTMGFVLQIVFEAVVMSGELIALGMGLSFATLADPLRGVSTGVLGQYFLILSSLLFLSFDGHLMLIAAVVESFRMMPVGAAIQDIGQIGHVVSFASRMFTYGVQIALPAMISLLLVNVAFGVISRAAPTLNPIAVGFPISLTLGLVILQFSLSPLLTGLQALLEEAWLVVAGVLQVP